MVRQNSHKTLSENEIRPIFLGKHDEMNYITVKNILASTDRVKMLKMFLFIRTNIEEDQGSSTRNESIYLESRENLRK